MAGRRLGVRSVRPELGDRSIKVAGPDGLRCVGLAGEGVDRVAATAVRSECVRTDHRGRDVDHVVACGVEQAAIADDFDGLRLEERIGRRIAEPRRRPGIEGHTGGATGWYPKRRHVPPVRTDRSLNAARKYDPVLTHEVFDL